MTVPTTVAGLALAFGGYPTLRNAAAGIDLLDRLPGDRSAGEDLLKWVVAVSLLGYVLLVEGRSLDSIGVGAVDPLPIVGIDGAAGLLGWWVLGVLATIALSTAVYNVFRHFELGTSAEFTAEQADRPIPRFLFTAVTAGVTESLLYQAYPIERLAALTGSLLLAGAVAWGVFTAVHYASGRFSAEETLFTSAPALAVTVLYVASGSLAVVVLVHSSVNALSFLSQ